MRKSRQPSQRQLRVGELLRHALAEMLARGEVHSQVLETLTVTVSEVSLSPDLKRATAYVVPLGGGREDEMLQALTKARKFIRGRISHEIKLKHSPEIEFKIDETFTNFEKIDKILHRPDVARDLD